MDQIWAMMWLQVHVIPVFLLIYCLAAVSTSIVKLIGDMISEKGGVSWLSENTKIAVCAVYLHQIKVWSHYYRKIQMVASNFMVSLGHKQQHNMSTSDSQLFWCAGVTGSSVP